MSRKHALYLTTNLLRPGGCCALVVEMAITMATVCIYDVQPTPSIIIIIIIINHHHHRLRNYLEARSRKPPEKVDERSVRSGRLRFGAGSFRFSTDLSME